MEDSKIRAIVQQEIQRLNSNGRYTVQNLPLHTHNGIDSKPVFSPTIIYAGFVPYTNDPGLEKFLPSGWSIRYDGVGQYTVIHNLGTMFYSFVANTTQSTNKILMNIVSPFQNETSITFWDAAGDRQDTSFNFVLAQVNNKTGNFPIYKSQNIS